MDGGRRYPRFAFCFPDCVRLLRIAGESVGGGRSAAGCGWPLFPVSRIRAARFSGIAPMPRSVYRRCRTEKIKIGRMMMKVRQISYICTPNAEVAQSVEHQLPKLRVTGSNPAFRSRGGVFPERGCSSFFLHQWLCGVRCHVRTIPGKPRSQARQSSGRPAKTARQ